MSRTSTRVVAAVATAVVTVVPVFAASSAVAATGTAPRYTVAVELGDELADMAAYLADDAGVDGRSLGTMRHAAAELSKENNGAWGRDFMAVSGLTDRNRDGLDDDGAMTIRVLDNRATVTLHRNRTYAVADAGFVFTNSRSVLKESAQAVDRILRLVASAPHGADAWDLAAIRGLRDEAAPGVRVVSDFDGNHDGYDDDGRLTFLAGGKAVTLTIGNTPKEVGKVTYGPTWQTTAPHRVHHPVAPAGPHLSSAHLAPRWGES